MAAAYKRMFLVSRNRPVVLRKFHTGTRTFGRKKFRQITATVCMGSSHFSPAQSRIKGLYITRRAAEQKVAIQVKAML